MTGEVSEAVPHNTEKAIIPPASYDDLLSTAFDRDDDDKHRFRWLQFMDEQPIIAQQVLDSIGNLVEDAETRKKVIDELTLVYGALRTAVIRENEAV